jgi:hypothetical protein
MNDKLTLTGRRICSNNFTLDLFDMTPTVEDDNPPVDPTRGQIR